MENEAAEGRWSNAEHETFVRGLKEHGREWKLLAKMIGTRSVVQIRTHAQKYFQKLLREEGLQAAEAIFRGGYGTSRERILQQEVSAASSSRMSVRSAACQHALAGISVHSSSQQPLPPAHADGGGSGAAGGGGQQWVSSKRRRDPAAAGDDADDWSSELGEEERRGQLVQRGARHAAPPESELQQQQPQQQRVPPWALAATVVGDLGSTTAAQMAAGETDFTPQHGHAPSLPPRSYYASSGPSALNPNLLGGLPKGLAAAAPPAMTQPGPGSGLTMRAGAAASLPFAAPHLYSLQQQQHQHARGAGAAAPRGPAPVLPSPRAHSSHPVWMAHPGMAHAAAAPAGSRLLQQPYLGLLWQQQHAPPGYYPLLLQGQGGLGYGSLLSQQQTHALLSHAALAPFGGGAPPGLQLPGGGLASAAGLGRLPPPGLYQFGHQPAGMGYPRLGGALPLVGAGSFMLQAPDPGGRPMLSSGGGDPRAYAAALASAVASRLPPPFVVPMQQPSLLPPNLAADANGWHGAHDGAMSAPLGSGPDSAGAATPTAVAAILGLSHRRSSSSRGGGGWAGAAFLPDEDPSEGRQPWHRDAAPPSSAAADGYSVAPGRSVGAEPGSADDGEAAEPGSADDGEAAAGPVEGHSDRSTGYASAAVEAAADAASGDLGSSASRPLASAGAGERAGGESDHGVAAASAAAAAEVASGPGAPRGRCIDPTPRGAQAAAWLSELSTLSDGGGSTQQAQQDVGILSDSGESSAAQASDASAGTVASLHQRPLSRKAALVIPKPRTASGQQQQAVDANIPPANGTASASSAAAAPRAPSLQVAVVPAPQVSPCTSTPSLRWTEQPPGGSSSTPSLTLHIDLGDGTAPRALAVPRLAHGEALELSIDGTLYTLTPSARQLALGRARGGGGAGASGLAHGRAAYAVPPPDAADAAPLPGALVAAGLGRSINPQHATPAAAAVVTAALVSVGPDAPAADSATCTAVGTESK